MTLVQSILGKLGAAFAGAIAFFALWTAVSSGPLILGIVHEQTAFSVAACVLVTLGVDAAFSRYQLKTDEKQGNSRFRQAPLPNPIDPSSFYQCAKCGIAFEQPIRIKEFGTEKVLYLACPNPSCRAPIQQPAPVPAATTAQQPPLSPQPRATPDPVPAATTPDPEPSKEPEPPLPRNQNQVKETSASEPGKPRVDVEILPDGSVLVNGILVHVKKS